MDNLTEKKEILNKYRNLLRICRKIANSEDKRIIRKAFNIALEAHKDMRRKSGEPFIYHPIEVAIVCVNEIGLGATSVACALLHDVVESKPEEYPIEYIKKVFGKKIAQIVDGLTKINRIGFVSSGTDKNGTLSSLQVESWRKLLMTISEDLRIILIKLADRLHNMRTLSSLPKDKQNRNISETNYIFAPLAHRLGLYAIKTELEDLCLKYNETDIYNTIVEKIKDSQKERAKFLIKFRAPIVKALKDKKYKFRIIARTKAVSSIYNKMKKKDISFEEIYDLYAIRIIIDAPYKEEKEYCWNVYSIITDIYKPKSDRLRDWISIPKANGYQSLHITVMSQSGSWVEIQIRSTRMDEIAEKGFAAHWKYKDVFPGESNIDRWVKVVREILNNKEQAAAELVENFKSTLFNEEIFIFTPKGEKRTLPAGSTALDFAYAIHSAIGNKCIAAKVNYELKEISYELKNGDQVEILTSDQQEPSEEWLNIAKTTRAKTSIKEVLKEIKKVKAKKGENILRSLLIENNLKFSNSNNDKLIKHYNLLNYTDLFCFIADNKINYKDIVEILNEKERAIWLSFISKAFSLIKSGVIKNENENTTENIKQEIETIDFENKFNYSLATCCNPIPGDDFIAYPVSETSFKIHRSNCPEAVQYMTKYSEKIVKGKWKTKGGIVFLVVIKLKGIDKLGLLNNITKVISEELNVNMRELHFVSSDGLFEGSITLSVLDTSHLGELINNLKKINGITNIYRYK